MANLYSAPTAESDFEPEKEELQHPVSGPPLEPLPIAEGDELVTVYSTNDAVEAEMLTQVLIAEGIPTPMFQRMTGAQIGLGWMAAPQLIRVPKSREVEARELIENLLEEQQSNERIEDDEYEPPVSTKRREIARFGIGVFVLAPMLIGVLFAFMAMVIGMLRSPP